MTGASTYPDVLDTDANMPRIDGSTPTTPAWINNLTDAVESIEAALGPLGSPGPVLAGVGGLAAHHEAVLSGSVAVVANTATDVLSLTPGAGTWRLTGHVTLAGFGGAGTAVAWIEAPAGTALNGSQDVADNGWSLTLVAECVATLSAGQVVKLRTQCQQACTAEQNIGFGPACAACTLTAVAVA